VIRNLSTRDKNVLSYVWMHICMLAMGTHEEDERQRFLPTLLFLSLWPTNDLPTHPSSPQAHTHCTHAVLQCTVCVTQIPWILSFLYNISHKCLAQTRIVFLYYYYLTSVLFFQTFWVEQTFFFFFCFNNDVANFEFIYKQNV
jgi:hypothetical protein